MNQVNQGKIWDYYQNKEMDFGGFSDARDRYVVKHLKSGQTVLDIGVGSGGVVKLALSKGVDIYAIDPSEETIDQIIENLDLSDKAKVGYAQEIPFDDGIFDVVVMSEVLEHLDDEILNATLSEVKRVLSPEGMFLSTVPYKESLSSSMVFCPECGNQFHRWGHVQSFDKVKMKKLLNENGFIANDVRITTFVDWQRKGTKQLVKSLVRLLLARMGEDIADPHIVSLAKKSNL